VSAGKRDRRLLCRAALGALILLPGPVALALSGGTPDTGGRFPAVVVLVAGPRSQCSGTKIGPRRLLTAAHCVVDTGTGELRPAYRPGGRLRIGNAPVPAAAGDLHPVQVRRTHLAPAFSDGLQRFLAFKRKRIAAFREQFQGTELLRRIMEMEATHHFTARYPDAAVIDLDTATPDIPSLPVDQRPLTREAPVTLVGYGCASIDQRASENAAHPFGVRRWAETAVIRVDPVNFFSYARYLRDGAPSLCPGDSGGPVLRDGKVVGVHGTVYGIGGLAGEQGGHSNMSVSLPALKDWAALRAGP
jgi:hypothetical protein